MILDAMRPRFHDREQAGDQLARLLQEYRDRPDVAVLGIARGGLPVAARVAAALGAPLDVLVVRKLGFPGQEELAMGAIGPGGVRVLNPEVLREYPVPEAAIEAAVRRERAELERRERTYRAGRPPLQLAGRTAIIVDDGLATGSTMRAAVAAVRAQRPAAVVVAVPVAAESSRRALEAAADRVVCVLGAELFFAVGQWYEDFSQTTDEDVRRLLEAQALPPAGKPPSKPAAPGAPGRPA